MIQSLCLCYLSQLRFKKTCVETSFTQFLPFITPCIVDYFAKTVRTLKLIFSRLPPSFPVNSETNEGIKLDESTTEPWNIHGVTDAAAHLGRLCTDSCSAFVFGQTHTIDVDAVHAITHHN